MEFYENVTTTTTPTPPPPHNDHKFIIIPLVVVFLIIVLSAFVYWMARRTRRLNTIKHSLMVLYEFDSNEQEWESLNSQDNPNYSGVHNTSV